mgnify:CR=1 FL=1|tara:strand:- start:1651 stop:1917 length:267 start_codon:yes stop_codon:yes gene_type:complete
MNDKIIQCAICTNEMREWEGNNPQPLLPDMEDKVCRDCNDFVTALRLVLRGTDNETMRGYSEVIVSIMSLASGLKKARKMHMQMMEEE